MDERQPPSLEASPDTTRKGRGWALPAYLRLNHTSPSHLPRYRPLCPESRKDPSTSSEGFVPQAQHASPQVPYPDLPYQTVPPRSHAHPPQLAIDQSTHGVDDADRQRQVALRRIERRLKFIPPLTKTLDFKEALTKAYVALNLTPYEFCMNNFIALARDHVYDSFHVRTIPLRIHGKPERVARGLLVREIAGTFLRIYGDRLWPPRFSATPWLTRQTILMEVDGTCWRGSDRGYTLDEKGQPFLGETPLGGGWYHYEPLVEGEMASELLGLEEIRPPARGTLNDMSLSELGWKMQEFFDALLQIPATRSGGFAMNRHLLAVLTFSASQAKGGNVEK